MVVSPVIGVVVLAAHLFIIWPYKHEHGLDRHGALHKCSEALQTGDGKEAIFWAKKAYAYEILSRKTPLVFRDEDEFAPYIISQAYAVDGQHELAELWSKIAAEEGE